MGRLLACITLAPGLLAPVRETEPRRRAGATGYRVIHPDEDVRNDYIAIRDVGGDGSAINGLISRLAPGGEVVLAGICKHDLGSAFSPAFVREASIRVAAQRKMHDLPAVTPRAASHRRSKAGSCTR